jgi:AraC family transcriptional regulator, transcriptional activator of pobA
LSKRGQNILVDDHDSRVTDLHFDIIVWSKIPPNESAPDAHRHLFNELMFVTSGGGWHHIEFDSFELQTQNIHFVPASHVHKMERALGSAGFSLSFSDDFLPESLSAQPFWGPEAAIFAPVMAPDAQTWQTLLLLAEQIKGEFAQKQLGYLLVIKQLLSAVLLKSRRFQSLKSTVSNRSVLPEKLLAFRDVLQKTKPFHYQVSEIAAKIFVTPNYLNELCRAHLGMSAQTILHTQVCTEAKRLLRHTALTINEVSDQLGFESPAYFSRFFKKHTETTPTAYRNQVS